jgi:hypothetical protein
MRTGGGHQCYTGVSRDRDSATIIPTIAANGMDVAAIAGIYWEQLQRGIAAHGFSLVAHDFDQDEVKRRLAAIPEIPNEKLR